MSVADAELDEPGRVCEQCGESCERLLCGACRSDVEDMYADWVV